MNRKLCGDARISAWGIRMVLYHALSKNQHIRFGTMNKSRTLC